MAAVHLGRLSRNGLDLDADLLTLLGAVDGLVINLDAGDHADVHKLKHTEKSKSINSETRQNHKQCGRTSYPFTGDAERRALSQDSGLDGNAHHDGISGVEDELRKNSQLHREYSYMPDDT